MDNLVHVKGQWGAAKVIINFLYDGNELKRVEGCIDARPPIFVDLICEKEGSRLFRITGKRFGLQEDMDVVFEYSQGGRIEKSRSSVDAHEHNRFNQDFKYEEGRLIETYPPEKNMKPNERLSSFSYKNGKLERAKRVAERPFDVETREQTKVDYNEVAVILSLLI